MKIPKLTLAEKEKYIEVLKNNKTTTTKANEFLEYYKSKNLRCSEDDIFEIIDKSIENMTLDEAGKVIDTLKDINKPQVTNTATFKNFGNIVNYIQSCKPPRSETASSDIEVRTYHLENYTLRPKLVYDYSNDGYPNLFASLKDYITLAKDFFKDYKCLFSTNIFSAIFNELNPNIEDKINFCNTFLYKENINIIANDIRKDDYILAALNNSLTQYSEKSILSVLSRIINLEIYLAEEINAGIPEKVSEIIKSYQDITLKHKDLQTILKSFQVGDEEGLNSIKELLEKEISNVETLGKYISDSISLITKLYALNLDSIEPGRYTLKAFLILKEIINDISVSEQLFNLNNISDLEELMIIRDLDILFFNESNGLHVNISDTITKIFDDMSRFRKFYDAFIEYLYKRGKYTIDIKK